MKLISQELSSFHPLPIWTLIIGKIIEMYLLELQKKKCGIRAMTSGEGFQGHHGPLVFIFLPLGDLWGLLSFIK